MNRLFQWFYMKHASWSINFPSEIFGGFVCAWMWICSLHLYFEYMQVQTRLQLESSQFVFLMVCPHPWMFDSSTGAYWSPQRYHWNFTFSDENTLALLASARAPSARFNSSFEWRQTQNWVNTQSPLSMKFGCLSCVWRSKLWFSTTIPGPSLLFSCSKIMNFWRHSLTLGEVMEKWWIRTKILFQMIKSKIFHRFMSVHVYIAYFLTKTHQIHLHR